MKRRDGDKGHESGKCRVPREELGEFALYKVVRKNFSEVRPEELLKAFSLGKKESFILTF